MLLPGRNYPATMPLLTFAGRAALQHGWRVRAVSWTAPDLEAARSTGGEVVQLEGAEHAVFTDDAVRTAELHVEVTRTVDSWFRTGR